MAVSGFGHVPLAPNVRVAIQMAIAVGASILVGEILSGRRFYWAVIAAFVTFMGANSATEQVRKGVNRVIGTAVGAVVGALLAHLVGDRGWLAVAWLLPALALSLVALALSTWFDVEVVSIVVASCWFAVPLVLHLPVDDLLDLMAGPIQIVSIASGGAALVTAIARHTRFDYKGI